MRPQVAKEYEGNEMLRRASPNFNGESHKDS
jgi:hypothetical protein